MGWGIFPDLEDEKVLCQRMCGHIDCVELRKIDQHCLICGGKMEAGDKYYFRGGNYTVVHMACAIEEAEKKQEGRKP